MLTSHAPTTDQIREATTAAAEHQIVVIGTIDATPEQARLVDALLQESDKVITVALRTPYDLASYPSAPTHLCTYGIHRPSMEALAAVLFGEAVAPGRLPVSIPDIAATS